MKKLLIQAFDEPNHTQTPNKFFDMIPDMSEAELRVTLVMIRHTLGYHKSTFKLGMKKLGEESGLTRQGAMSGAEAAEQRGIFKRANPESQKEAEWELVLLPVNVDDMSSRITPSVNVDDTTCNLGLQQVGVKENYKENKETSFFSDEEKAQNEAKMQAYLEAARLAEEAKNKGQAWAGREHIRADLLDYADWYNKTTGQTARTKGALKSWQKALGEWKEEGLTISNLQEAHAARSKWRTVADPNELTKDAAAIHALPAGGTSSKLSPVQYEPDGTPISW